MSLTSLHVNGFRNLTGLSFTPSDDINVIVGENGSGKSSLLEAIYFLSHGKSFRTNKFKNCIQHQQSSLTLHGKKRVGALNIPLGIQKSSDGTTVAKLHGKRCERIAQLAEVLPTQIITPESYELFFGGPKERRKFIDLGLFHVEHDFYFHWASYSKLLKQRNALLKQKPSNYVEQIKFWDKEFVRLANTINAMREAYIARFSTHFFDKIASQITLFEKLEFNFSPGWKRQECLAEQLEANFTRDLKQGFTSKGPHKADFNVQIEGTSVEEFYSRGQLKLLLYALKICQNSLIESETEKESLFLIDDLPSELSNETKVYVAQLLKQCDSQLFITAIDFDSISAVLEPLNKNIKLFHVKHGELITS